MGRDVSAELKNHFGKEVTTLTTCWKIVRRDGEVLGYTGHDKEIEYDGVTYKPAESVEVSAMEQTADGAPDNMDISVAFGAISKKDIAKGKFDDADMYVFIINYKDLSQGVMKLISGNLGEVSLNEYGGKFDFKSLSDRLQNKTGRAYGYRCDTYLGSDRCKIDVLNYTFSGSVSSVTDRSTFTDLSKSEPDRYYTYGTVTFTSGSNEGWTKEVKAFGNGQFTLFEPMPYDIEAGDTFDAVAGCDGFPSTCKAKFDNFVNYQGFPHLPGRDEVLQYPDAK